MDRGVVRVTTATPHFSKKDKKMAERKVWNDATRLTPKEQQVYDLFRKGFKAKDIAVILGITPRAAQTRLALAKDKVRCGG
jgi:DNA-binding CsgD family transcriptional regulator